MRRASAAAISGLRIIVSVTTARTPAASTCGGALGVDRVDHERAAELGVRARDADARDLDAERAHQPVGRALHRRAADDRADRRRPGRARATSTSRMPGTARIGPIEITGFDGQITIVSAASSASSTPGRGPGRLRAVEANRDDRRLGPLADEPLLHRELLGVRRRRGDRDAGARPRSSVIGSEREVEAPRRGDLGRHLGERRARAQPLGAEEVGREVLVAEPEPGRHVVAVERVERRERLAFEAPALLGVRRAGERVGDRVEIGGDVQPVELVVVAGVDDGDDIVRRHDAHESGEETAAPTPPARATSTPGM